METYERWMVFYLPSLAKRLSDYKGYQVSEENVSEAFYLTTYHKHDYEWLLSVFDIEITEDEIYETVKDFDFAILTGVELPDSYFPATALIDNKVRIKDRNHIWVVHKNDPDDLPSKPHAHLIGQGLKLNLFTGDLYRSTTLVGQIGKKELNNIRELFIQKGVQGLN